MKADLSVYISFDGRAREALTFYAVALGGEALIETFGAYGLATLPEEQELVLYGVLRSPHGFVLRATDRPLQDGEVGLGTGIALCLNGEETDILVPIWDRLAEGGTIVEPLQETPWGDANGVLRDRYGILWIVNIGQSE